MNGGRPETAVVVTPMVKKSAARPPPPSIFKVRMLLAAGVEGSMPIGRNCTTGPVSFKEFKAEASDVLDVPLIEAARGLPKTVD